MRWRIIDKSGATIPTSGKYMHWKLQLAAESASQCVYCCVPESRFGGTRNFHVEHFRPKSIFPLLTNEYGNLFYACGVCNIFKGDDWPSEHEVGKYDKATYPNPSVVDYCDFLDIDELSGKVSSKQFTGNYLIERLHLNRPQMIGLRAVTAIFHRIDQTIKEIEGLWQSGKVLDSDKDSVVEVLLSLYKISRRFSDAKPYSADQLR